MAQEYDILVNPQWNGKSSRVTINPYLSGLLQTGSSTYKTQQLRSCGQTQADSQRSALPYVNGCESFLRAFTQTLFKSQNPCRRCTGCIYKVVEYNLSSRAQRETHCKNVHGVPSTPTATTTTSTKWEGTVTS